MKHRFCAAALAAVLLLSAAPLSPAASAAFSDAEGTWAAEVIEKAEGYGLMNGYPDGTFGVGKELTRGEFVAVLCRMFGWDAASPGAPSFSDCPASHWAYSYVETALAHGVMDAGGAFRPEDYISREEMAVMLVRVYERYTSKLDWLHGFYAFSSYSQIDLTASMDAVSVGWARMEYDPTGGPTLNSARTNGNDWVRPDDPTPATDYWDARSLPYNLNVYASASDSIPLPDGTTTSTVAAVTGTPEARAQAVAALTAASADYAGLTIDFEGLKGDTIKQNYVAFLKELDAALPQGKTLYVCVQPDTWYTGFDYRGIGEAADKVILMAHDYQWTSVPDSYVGTTNTDSPVTPFASVYEALRDLTDPATGVADRSKLALQISFGSAGFHVDGEDRLLETTIYHPAPSTLALRLAQPDTQVVYSEEFRNPCALYTTEDGSRYKVWYENEQSVLDKVALARMFGITGVSLWRIGNIPADGAYDVWSALLTQR